MSKRQIHFDRVPSGALPVQAYSWQEEAALEYEVVETELEKKLGKGLSLYGVRAVVHQGEKTKVKDLIQDICTNREEVCILVQALNEHQASLLHFHDIIQDFCDSDYRLYGACRC